MRGLHEASGRGVRWTAALLCATLASTAGVPVAWAEKGSSKAVAAKASGGTKGTLAAKGGGKTAHGGAAAHKKGKDKAEQAKRAQARKLYADGEKKLAGNDFAGAYESYKAANDLLPAPQTLYKMAFALDKAEKTPEAVAAYKTFLDSSPPDSMSSKVDDAKQRMAELRKKLPAEVTISSDPVGATIAIDGVEQKGVTPVEAKMDAGHHKVHATLSGYDAAEKEIDVEGGGTQDLSITLEKSAPPPVAAAEPPPAPPPPPPPPAAPPPPPEPAHSNTAAYVLLGVAGAGAVVGTIFGVKALQDKSDFNHGEKTNDKADSVERNALIADMALGAAVTFGVTGTVLLLIGGGDQNASQAATNTRGALAHTGRIELIPVIGMHEGGVGATLQF